MKTLNYYLALATKNDADAAYNAAKLMMYEEYNEVIVQNMLRKAANLGSSEAQRYLGFLGMKLELILPNSTVSNIIRNKDYSEAYNWFHKGAESGDIISSIAVSKCLQYGIGTKKDPVKANEILEAISSQLTFDLLPITAFFDIFHFDKQNAKSCEIGKCISLLLAS